jgi:hypothetical protein
MGNKGQDEEMARNVELPFTILDLRNLRELGRCAQGRRHARELQDITGVGARGVLLRTEPAEISDSNLSTPEMRTATRFHGDDAGRQLAEKLQHLSAPQLLAQDRTTIAVGPMHLEHILRQIEPDRDNLRHDRPPLLIIAAPPMRNDTTGRVHSIRALTFSLSKERKSLL